MARQSRTLHAAWAKMSSRRNDTSRRSSFVAVLIPTLAGLLGSTIGATSTGYVAMRGIASEQNKQQRQLEYDRDQATRNQRLPVYTEFREAANAYLTDQATRYPCVRDRLTTCDVTEDELQASRFRMQRAINNMHIFGTHDARLVVREVSATMPRTLVGASGDPVIGPVDEVAFDDAIRHFHSVMCKDVSPSPNDCDL